MTVSSERDLGITRRDFLSSTGVALTGSVLHPWLESDLSIRFSVTEPAGIDRRGEPVTGGVPFKPGQVTDLSRLALFTESGDAIPAQFSKLAGYEDGSVQWALVDFLADVPAKRTAVFAVKLGGGKAPSSPLGISENEELVEIDTGPARFTVNKEVFTVLDSVERDGARVAGAGGLEVVDADGNLWKAGKPSRVSWEYKGPVRATLRVDGPYLGADGKAFLSYTTRLTFWAGLPAVRVEHSLRNSNPAEGNDARIKEAKLFLGGIAEGESTETDGDWAATREGLLVVDRHTGGAFPGGLAPNKRPGLRLPGFHEIAIGQGKAVVWSVPPGGTGRGYGADHFALADCAHKDSETWFDFGAGNGNEERRKSYRSKLIGLADGAWISETEATGWGRFGTLADEIATYKKWGWKGAEDPRRREGTLSPHAPDLFIDGEDIHYESEADSAEIGLLMWIRTGERGWFDEGEAWARYFKSHYAFRTDGFEYDGCRHDNHLVAKASKRPANGAVFGWRQPKEYGWKGTRQCSCHFWGNGVFEYYCLTGDVDALEAGLDLAEFAKVSLAGLKGDLDIQRGWGRLFQCALRAYQVTRDRSWKAVADRYADSAIRAPNRDPQWGLCSYVSRAFLGFPKHLQPGEKGYLPARLDAYLKDQGITFKAENQTVVMTDRSGKTWKLWTQPPDFQLEICQRVLARYAEITGSDDARDIVVGLARAAREFHWSPHCKLFPGRPFIGLPAEGKALDWGAWDDAHAKCPDGGAEHSGYNSRFFADVFARAYAFSGDPEFLEWARRAWNVGSKRRYRATSQTTPDDQVAEFANHRAPKGAGVDIRCSARMFYEVPRARSRG